MEPRRRPRKVIPFPVQIGTRPSIVLLRGLAARCPACGARHIFEQVFRMKDRCPRCSLKFERVEGHWIGSLGVNTTVVFGTMLIALMTITFLAYPNANVPLMLTVEVALALLGPLAFFPSSRMLWTAIDLLMRPLAPGEIDPRFVVVDPYRDRPQGP
ncbi:MAG: DUF983 domain-containing protein [Actinomycetes bacterium]